jgi:uncharacterized protein
MREHRRDIDARTTWTAHYRLRMTFARALSFAALTGACIVCPRTVVCGTDIAGTDIHDVYAPFRKGGAMEKASPFLLLIGSNLFMTYAWYGHLKDLKGRALFLAIVVSWGVAFFEYCLQVPANRIGFRFYSLGQLKIAQEIITMGVFAVFSVVYMRVPLRLDFLWATLCLMGAAYFMFRGQPV